MEMIYNHRKRYIVKLNELDGNPTGDYKIRAMFSNRPSLCRIFVTLYTIQPATVNMVRKKLGEIFKINLSRQRVNDIIGTLLNNNLLNEYSFDEISKMIDITKKIDIFYNIRNEKQLEMIKGAHFYVVNDYGEKFIPWACRVIGVVCEDSEEQ